MNKAVKRTLIAVLITAIVLGALVGGLLLYKKLNTEAVNVYGMYDIAMTDYWGDSSRTEGIVETRNMQSVYLSNTQTITEIFVSEGQSVKEGDPLVSVDTTLTEIELERERIAVEQKKLDLENAQKELAKVNTYVAYTPPAPEPEPEVLPAQELPRLLGGQGTAELPYIYLWNDTQWYTEAFINGFLPKLEIAEESSETSADNAGETSSVPQGESSLQEDSPAAGEESSTAEPGTGESSAESSGADIPSGNGEESSAPSGNNEKPEDKTISIYVVFEERMYDNAAGELLKNWEIIFTRQTDNSVSFRIVEPSPNYDGKESKEEEDDNGGGYVYYGPQYTWAEIQQLKKEAEEKLRDADLALRVEELKYQQLQNEMQTGIITATVDGIVKTLNDEQTAKREGKPLCVVSGGGGYYIQGSLSELELATVQIGQEVTVTSWMNNYTSMTGVIVEIGEYPSSNNLNWSNGNSNVSYYPFYVLVSDDEILQSGEYVEVEYTPAASSSGIYLMNAFIREEGGRSYVYVAGEDGRLEKRLVVTGKSLWGSYLEILSGITMEDQIAFPYGNDVQEGAPTNPAGIDALYGY